MMTDLYHNVALDGDVQLLLLVTTNESNKHGQNSICLLMTCF